MKDVPVDKCFNGCIYGRNSTKMPVDQNKRKEK
jgi:hypothetical protein